MLAYVSRYFNVIAPVLRRVIRKRYGYELAAKAYNGARSIYRQMLADFPSIGADNPMADNAYEALVFFAMYRAADGELTPEMMREVVGDLFELPVVKGAIGLPTNLNRAADMRRMNDSLRSHARWVDEHPAEAPYTWDFNFGDSKGDTRICYHFTRCPLNDFCREQGLMAGEAFVDIPVKCGAVSSVHVEDSTVSFEVVRPYVRQLPLQCLMHNAFNLFKHPIHDNAPLPCPISVSLVKSVNTSVPLSSEHFSRRRASTSPFP